MHPVRSDHNWPALNTSVNDPKHIQDTFTPTSCWGCQGPRVHLVLKCVLLSWGTLQFTLPPAALHFFLVCRAVTKTTMESWVNDVFSCYFLVRDVSGRFRFKLQKACGQMRPRPPQQVVCVNASWMCLGGCLHLYLALTSCDQITQDVQV